MKDMTRQEVETLMKDAWDAGFWTGRNVADRDDYIKEFMSDDRNTDIEDILAAYEEE